MGFVRKFAFSFFPQIRKTKHLSLIITSQRDECLVYWINDNFYFPISIPTHSHNFWIMKSSILSAFALQILLCLAISSPSPTILESLLSSRSESSPNPINSLYPNNITGAINSTLSVVPIPYTLARSIIPAQYGILTKAYHSLLKGFPADSYPVWDHFHAILLSNTAYSWSSEEQSIVASVCMLLTSVLTTFRYFHNSRVVRKVTNGWYLGTEHPHFVSFCGFARGRLLKLHV